MVLVLALVTPIIIGADDATSKKDSNPDFAAMIRELQLEVKKIKDEILKMHAELKERQERAERRRALQKQEEEKLQEIEYQNSRQQ
jgi:DNA repair photolyase